MTGKLFFAVFISAVLVPENGAYAPEVAAIYKWHQNMIETFLDEELKEVHLVDKPFADALNDAGVKLLTGGIPGSEGLIHNTKMHQKSAMISADKILYYLKRFVASSFFDLEKDSPNFEKEMKSDMQKKLLKDGWSVEKVENCSQKYGKDLNMTTGWRIQGQAGCFMDLVGEGQLILDEIVSVSENITQALNGITCTKERYNKISFHDIRHLYGKFPAVEAYIFIDDQEAQQEKLGKCYDLKIKQSATVVKAFLDKIIECTMA